VRFHQEGREPEDFFARKQAKGHGSWELVEGVLPPGARVAVVDDPDTSSMRQGRAGRTPARSATAFCISGRKSK
jgi:hypothetical protein